MLQAIVFASLPFYLYIREALEPSWQVHNTGSESRVEWIVGVGERVSRAKGCPCFQGWGRSHRGSRGRATSVGGGRGYVGQQGRHRGRGQPVLFTSSRIYGFISRQISTYDVTTIAPTKVPKQNINNIYIQSFSDWNRTMIQNFVILRCGSGSEQISRIWIRNSMGQIITYGTVCPRSNFI